MVNDRNKFDVLLVDPPWQYDNVKTGGNMKSGASQQYDVLSPVEIQNLWDHTVLPSLMEQDSACFLWSTNSMLPYAMAAIELWDFEYKTMITWVKRNYGLGYWYRGKTEHMLFGVRGKVKPFRLAIPNVIFSGKVLAHSRKPEASYELVEDSAMMVSFDKAHRTRILELFARRQRTSPRMVDWICLGKEITDNDIELDLEALAAYKW